MLGGQQLLCFYPVSVIEASDFLFVIVVICNFDLMQILAVILSACDRSDWKIADTVRLCLRSVAWIGVYHWRLDPTFEFELDLF